MAEQSSEKVAQAKIIQAVRDLIKREAEIREECGIGENLRVVRNKLNALLKDLEANVNLSLTDDQSAASEESEKVVDNELVPDENHAIVYLHLFNVRGNVMSSWSSMLSDKSLYEFSVNRPIYATKKHVKIFAENKPPEERHAFLSFNIEKQYIVGGLDVSSGNVDALGQPLLKLKEGAFNFNNLVELTHKDKSYVYVGNKFVPKN